MQHPSTCDTCITVAISTFIWTAHILWGILVKRCPSNDTTSVWYYLTCVIWNVPAAIIMLIAAIHIYTDWSLHFAEPVTSQEDQNRQVRERMWQAGSLLITSIVLWYTAWIEFLLWSFHFGSYAFTGPYPLGQWGMEVITVVLVLLVIVAWLTEALISVMSVSYFLSLVGEMGWLPKLSWTRAVEKNIPEGMKLEPLSTQEEV